MSRLLETARMVPHVEPVTGLTAWEVCLRLADLQHLIFFDSAQSSELGRYSFVAGDPTHFVSSRSDRGDPLGAIRDNFARFAVEPIRDLPPFQGGAAGLFSYDLSRHFEHLPRPLHDDFAIPDLALGFYDWVIAFDAERDDAWLISTGYPEYEPTRRLQRAVRRADEVKRWLDRRAPPPPRRLPTSPSRLVTPQFPVEGLPGITSNFSRQRYLDTVTRAVDYVHAGDCFQVNIAQRLVAANTETPLALYRRLRECNPAPFAGYFDLGDHAILSASPERFLCVRGQEVETRPIKGTRPRGSTLAEDQRLADELRVSAKDRAENVMIVDLIRNDLGRVCEYGSIRVGALCRLESYPYVHHLVSQVRGRLRAGLGPTDLLRAAFPGGSVTGAPKIRAMEIIAELEQTARGAYCGCLGYLGFDGSMDTNLLIRTIVHSPGAVHFSVGGGIVADSTPEREYAETWHKAAGLLKALRDDWERAMV